MRSLKNMFLGKAGYIYHPLGAAAVAFLAGLLIMWLIGKGIIPTGTMNFGICPCK